MNRYFLIMIIIFFLNPSNSDLSSKQDESGINRIILKDLCLENLEFKEKYFRLLKRIDTVVLRKFDKSSPKSHQNDLDSEEYSLINNLDTLSYYTSSVSYSKLFDYSFEYKNLEQYNSDKKKWIEYYEDNKCSNLIWVDTLIRAKKSNE